MKSKIKQIISLMNHLKNLESLEFDLFAGAFSQQFVNTIASRCEVTAVCAEIAEHFALSCTHSHVTITKNQINCVPSHCSSRTYIRTQVIAFVVCQRNNQSAARNSAVLTDSCFGVTGKLTALRSLGNEEEIRMVIDVLMNVCFVEGIETKNERSFANSTTIDAFENFFEIRTVVFVVFEYFPYEKGVALWVLFIRWQINFSFILNSPLQLSFYFF